MKFSIIQIGSEFTHGGFTYVKQSEERAYLKGKPPETAVTFSPEERIGMARGFVFKNASEQ